MMIVAKTFGTAMLRLHAGVIAATSWRGERIEGNKNTTFDTVELSRKYPTKTGAWKTTCILRPKDLPRAMLTLQHMMKVS
jgi:hypothetical protein